MKKCISVLLLLLVIFLFISCEDGSLSIPDEDYKALQISQLTGMFESISRQPEAADDIISATQALLYNSYEDILPLNDQAIYQRGVAVGTALGSLFEAVARQPEAADTLDGAAELLIGPYSAGHLTGDLLNYARAAVSKPLNESIARQPECFDTFNLLCIKYLNVTIADITE